MAKGLTRALWIAAALAALTQAGARETLDTPRIRIELENGTPVRLLNRLTGESLEGTPADDSPGLRHVGGRLDPGNAETNRATLRDGKPTHELRAGNAALCTTTAEPLEDGVVMRQRGRRAAGGVSVVHWGLSGLPDDALTVIVPGMSGVAYGHDSPSVDLSFGWPSGWEAGMVLLQMEKGGFLVWADDPDLTFKQLRVRHAGGRFDLVFETENHAPFEALTEIASVDWRITPYAGDWRAGAELYRTWMADRFSLRQLPNQTPAWANDIRFVVLCGMDPDILPELARHAVPERTLLYVPNWRRDGYDRNYPDYTALPEFGPFVREAHRLGFRVMPHVNYFGLDPKHELYERFKEYQLRNTYDGALQWWTWPFNLKEDEEPDIKFAYIHPGCSEWRKILIERWIEVAKTYDIDAFHLDQTLCIPNHAGGRVEGLTVPEGNLLLHRELREALPNVAISGEGLDEVTLPYEAFAQRHAPMAVDHVERTWNNAFIRCAHPISSYLFLPYNTIYGYLGMSNPGETGVFDAWMRAYESWGVVPTYAWPTIGQMQAPDGVADVLLDLAALWTRHDLRPDFGPSLQPGERFRHAGPDGTRVVIDALQPGGSVCRAVDAGGSREVYRYVTGVNRTETSGAIPNWPAYSNREILGLTPRQTYRIGSGPRDPDAPHLAELPENVILREARVGPAVTAFELADATEGILLDLAGPAAERQAGTRLGDDETPLRAGSTFRPERVRAGGVARTAIHAHPPWQLPEDLPAEADRATFGEYRVAIPAAGRTYLELATALRDGVNGRSDGVTFRVLVDGTEVLRTHHTEEAWKEHTTELSEFAGKTVALRLETDPGPDRDPSFDWALWGDPRITYEQPPRQGTVAFANPGPMRAVLQSNRPAQAVKVVPEGGRPVARTTVGIPGTVLFVAEQATPVQGSVRLGDLPHHMSATVAGMPAALPLQYVSYGAASATSGGDEREGFAAHPPSQGRTYADYVLRLPDDAAATLAFEYGIRDGSKTEGCRFLVEVNGETRFDELLTAADGWHPATVNVTPAAGRDVVLTLAVDAAGNFNFDWAFWAEPRLVLTTE